MDRGIRDEQILLDDLIYPEGPRWHEGRLYVADFYAREIVWCDLDGNKGKYLDVPGQPSGMGWLPDGRMLTVSMRDASVLVTDGINTEIVADLSARSPCTNEMIVDRQGRAYVGGMMNVYSPDLDLADAGKKAGSNRAMENLYLVDCSRGTSSAAVRVVATDLNFPNGTVITPDGRTLIVAESMSQRLTIFDIAEDGSLENRRNWAELSGMPDGICLDEEGCIWVAICFPEEKRAFQRIAEGGQVMDVITSSRVPMAVALGGPDRDHIFLVETAVVGVADEPGLRVRGNGRVRTGRVPVPGPPFP